MYGSLTPIDPFQVVYVLLRYCCAIVDGSEIQRSPVEVGSWNPHYLQGFITIARWLEIAGFLNHQRRIRSWSPKNLQDFTRVSHHRLLGLKFAGFVGGAEIAIRCRILNPNRCGSRGVSPGVFHHRGWRWFPREVRMQWMRGPKKERIIFQASVSFREATWLLHTSCTSCFVSFPQHFSVWWIVNSMNKLSLKNKAALYDLQSRNIMWYVTHCYPMLRDL